METEMDYMIEEVETEVKPLTIELAKHYSRMRTLKGDRDPDSERGRQRVGWLHMIYQAGDFHSPVWSDVAVKSENYKVYRVDGGNSSTMLTQLNSDFPEDMLVTIRHFKASNIEAAIHLYEQFNQRGSTRTFTDLVRNRAAYNRELDGVSVTAVGRIARGICCHLSLHNPKMTFNPLDVIPLEGEFIQWADMFSGTDRFKRSPIIAAAYATYQVDPEAATEFWRKVIDKSSPKPTCPTRVLGEFIMQLNLDKTRAQKWTKRVVYVKCLHGWNAWRLGRTTNLSYFKGSGLPKVL